MLSSLTRVASHVAHNDSAGVPALYSISSGSYTQYTYDGYTVLVFSTSGSISFNGAGNKTVNCAVVGGGGSGGYPGGGGSGGGGAGGVLYLTLSNLDNDTCTFTVGQGGAVPTALGQGNGGTSSISFATNTGLNRSAEGGGRGCSYPSNGSSAAAGSGACGGGGPADATFKGFNAGALGAALDQEHLPGSGSIGYPGGFGFWSSSHCPSGGGGGMRCGGYSCGGRNVVGPCTLAYSTPNGMAAGYTPSTNHYRADGGDGINIPLSGFNPAWYFGGGGGGTGSYNSFTGQMCGNGGRGGGGAGARRADTINATGDTNSINAAGNGSLNQAGNGAPLSGGGGGGELG
jgi:mucin-19